MCVVLMVRATEIEPMIGWTMQYMCAIGVYARPPDTCVNLGERLCVYARTRRRRCGVSCGAEMRPFDT